MVLTHARDTLTKMITIQLLASVSLALQRMWLWLEVCETTLTERRSTFGNLCFLKPQEIETGLQFSKVKLLTDIFVNTLHVKPVEFYTHRLLMQLYEAEEQSG